MSLSLVVIALNLCDGWPLQLCAKVAARSKVSRGSVSEWGVLDHVPIRLVIAPFLVSSWVATISLGPVFRSPLGVGLRYALLQGDEFSAL